MISSISAGFGDTPEAVKFVSKKPAYAKIALTADEQKVLFLAFDESGGTGTGYDTAYADTNFNNVLEAAEQVPATGDVTGLSGLKPLVFDFGYNAHAEGVEEPIVVTLSRSYVSDTSVAVALRVRLREDQQDWEYTFRRTVPLNTDLEKTVVQSPRPLTANVRTQMAGGGLGIVATLAAGDFSIYCRTPQGSPHIRLLVQNADGKPVSDEAVPLDRLGYG